MNLTFVSLLFIYPGYVLALLVLLAAVISWYLRHHFPRALFVATAILLLAQLFLLNWASWQDYQSQKHFASVLDFKVLSPTQPLGSLKKFTIEVTATNSVSRPEYTEKIEIIRYGPVEDPQSANVWVRRKQDLNLSDCGKLYELEHPMQNEACAVTHLDGMAVGSRSDIYGKTFVIETGGYWITIRNSSLTSVDEAVQYVRGLKTNSSGLAFKPKLF